jgi:hypothetical protein
MARIGALATSYVTTMLLAACGGAPTSDTTPSADQTALPHPDALAGINWKVGDTCVTEYKFGFKKVVHTAVVTDTSGGHTTLSDTADDGSSRVIVFEGADSDKLAKSLSASDGQQIEFQPPLQRFTFPLKPGDRWPGHSVVTGQTFQLTLDVKSDVMPWETVTVPAGQFAAIKVVGNETYSAGRNNKGESFTGTGTHTVWLTPAAKCLVQGVYKSSFGAKTTYRLLSFKPG